MKTLNLFIMGWVWLFMSTHPLKAQWTSQMLLDSTFSAFQANQVPGGTLADKSFQVVPFAHFGPINDSQISIGRWFQLAEQIRAMSIGQTSIPSVDSLTRLRDLAMLKGVIPIMGLLWQYGKLDDKALEQGFIDTSKGQIQVVPNTEPFKSSILFAASPGLSMPLNTQLARFVISPGYFFTNLSIQGQMYFDPDDGKGVRKVSWGDTIDVVYADTNAHRLTFQITDLIGNVEYESYFIFRFLAPAIPPFIYRTSEITGEIPYEIDEIARVKYYSNHNPNSGEYQTSDDFAEYEKSPFAKGVVSYLFPVGSQGDCFKKPLIFVEGIDFGVDGYPKFYCDPSTGKCGSLGFIDILEGKWQMPGHISHNMPLPSFAWGRPLIDSLRQQEYEIIYLDFQDGATYMQRNAFVLVRLIKEIQSRMCSNEEIVVVGASMGGQLVKYALSYMESNKIPHCVREMVMFDSPNQGANIPIGYQALLKKYGTDNKVLFKSALMAYEKKINRPAARQLLIHHIDADGMGECKERKDFLRELQLMGGYPEEARRVAVVNGSGTGVKLPFQSGDSLVKLNLPVGTVAGTALGATTGALIGFFTGNNPWALGLAGAGLGATVGGNYDFSAMVYALTGKDHGTGPMILDAKHNGFGSTGKIMSPLGALPLDNISGSSTNALASAQFSIFFNSQDDDLFHVGLKFVYPYHELSSFIPTYSALDLYHVDTGFYPSIQLPKDQPAVSLYPYHAWYGPNGNNESHVQIGQGNGRWLLNELRQSQAVCYGLPSVYQGAFYQEYNFTTWDRNVLNSMVIQNQCTLGINQNKPGEYGQLMPPIPGTYLTVRTRNCGAVIEVKEGGRIEVGTGVGPETYGTLKISNYSSLILESGSQLIINKGSKVIIAENARLILYHGCEIVVEEGAELIIDGEIHLHPDAKFAPAGTGKITLNVAQVLSFGHQVFRLENRKVEFGKSIFLPVTFDSVIFNECQVFVDSSVLLKTEAGYVNIYNSNFKERNSLQTWNGIQMFGQRMNIHQSRFQMMKTGLQFLSIHDIEGNMTQVVIKESENGIYGLKDIPKIQSCRFENNTKGIHVGHGAYPIEIEGSTFLQNDTGLIILGDTGCHVYIDGSTFKNEGLPILFAGIAQNQSNVMTLKCCRFGQCGPTTIQDAVINLSSIRTWKQGSTLVGGRNIFNNSPIKLAMATGLYIEQGENDFKVSALTSSYLFEGILYQATDTIQADENYFSSETGGQISQSQIGRTNVYVLGNAGSWNSAQWQGVLRSSTIGGCLSQQDQDPLLPIVEPNRYSVYPNPVKTGQHLHLYAEKDGTYEWVDLQGKSIKSSYLGKGDHLLSTEGFIPGIYMLRGGAIPIKIMVTE